MFQFTPAMFDPVNTADSAALKAQENLDDYLKLCPRMFLSRMPKDDGWIGDTLHNLKDTHAARLFNIEELVRKSCEHNPVRNIFNSGYNCILCGVAMKPTAFEEVEK